MYHYSIVRLVGLVRALTWDESACGTEFGHSIRCVIRVALCGRFVCATVTWPVLAVYHRCTERVYCRD